MNWYTAPDTEARAPDRDTTEQRLLRRSQENLAHARQGGNPVAIRLAEEALKEVQALIGAKA